MKEAVLGDEEAGIRQAREDFRKTIAEADNHEKQAKLNDKRIKWYEFSMIMIAVGVGATIAKLLAA